jgi:hypothetical protein
MIGCSRRPGRGRLSSPSSPSKAGIVLEAGGGIHRLTNGALAALDGGVRHAVSAPEGGFFLLTLGGQARAKVGP